MIYLLITSIIWAFSFGLIKGELNGLDSNFVAWVRMSCALLIFIPFFRIKKLAFKEALFLSCLGGLQYGLMYLFTIRAYYYLDAHQIVLFTGFTPIYVTILHDAFSKKFRPFYLFTAFLALLGVTLIYFQSINPSATLKGFLLVQLGDLCFAFGQVVYRWYRQRHDKLIDREIYLLLFVGACIVTSIALIGGGRGVSSLQQVTVRQWLVLVYLGSISSGICFFWWNKGAVSVNPGTLAIFNNIKIPLGVFFAITFFGEKANVPTLILSGALIVIALFLSEKYAKAELKLSTR